MIPLTLFAQRQLALTYVLSIGAGFGMGSVVFLTSIATLAYGIAARNAGFVLLPLVLFSMFGAVGGGRLMNRIGARALLASGFALLALGYGAASLTGLGLLTFLAASLPMGLGVGVVVGGSLRAIALDEAPMEIRAAAQGLVNICTSIGTLLSAAAISAIADFRGGGASGFAVAYLAVAALMGLMLLLTLALRADVAMRGPVVAA
jgi:MFS family permease